MITGARRGLCVIFDFLIDHRRIIGVDCCLIVVYIYHLGCVTDRARNSLRRLGDNRYCDNERYSF